MLLAQLPQGVPGFTRTAARTWALRSQTGELVFIWCLRGKKSGVPAVGNALFYACFFERVSMLCKASAAAASADFMLWE